MIQLPWVSRRYAEHLLSENQRLIAENRDLVASLVTRTAGINPFFAPTPSMHRPMGRKMAEQVIAEMEAKERLPLKVTDAAAAAN